jgi:succinate dehydrogenase / fumarate reductase iron-sulfur subunit
MASSPQHPEPEPHDHAARTAAVAAEKRPLIPSRAYLVPDGRLPVSEFAADRAGAQSPFGDDQRFPLPVERLTYTHPSENAMPQPH